MNVEFEVAITSIVTLALSSWSYTYLLSAVIKYFDSQEQILAKYFDEHIKKSKKGSFDKRFSNIGR